MSLMTWFRNLFSPSAQGRPAAPKRGKRPEGVELGRNDDCWCGSGKKYKKCHLNADAAEQREANFAAQFAKGKKKGGNIVTGAAGAGANAAKKPPRPEEFKGIGGQRQT